MPEGLLLSRDSGGDRDSLWQKIWDGTGAHPTACEPPLVPAAPQEPPRGVLRWALIFPSAHSRVSGPGQWGSPGVTALPLPISYHPLTPKTTPDSDQEGVGAVH